MIEWILHPQHWSRSEAFTTRETPCGRFVLRAWSFGGMLKWVLTDCGEIHSTHHTITTASQAVAKIRSLEASS